MEKHTSEEVLLATLNVVGLNRAHILICILLIVTEEALKGSAQLATLLVYRDTL